MCSVCEDGFCTVVLADSTHCWFSEDQHTAVMWFKMKTEVVDVKAFRKPRNHGDQTSLYIYTRCL